MRRPILTVLIFCLTYAGLAHADPGTIFASVLPSLFSGVASSLIGSLFGGKSEAQTAAAPPPPTPEAPTPMPTADDAAAKEAKRRAVVAQIARRGRASTILTGDDSQQAMG